MNNNQEWEKRNIVDEHRAKEIIDMYESLGFEVKVESFNPEICKTECNECMKESPEMFKIIYTKPKNDSNEGLFDE